MRRYAASNGVCGAKVSRRPRPGDEQDIRSVQDGKSAGSLNRVSGGLHVGLCELGYSLTRQVRVAQRQDRRLQPIPAAVPRTDVAEALKSEQYPPRSRPGHCRSAGQFRNAERRMLIGERPDRSQTSVQGLDKIPALGTAPGASPVPRGDRVGSPLRQRLVRCHSTNTTRGVRIARSAEPRSSPLAAHVGPRGSGGVYVVGWPNSRFAFNQHNRGRVEGDIPYCRRCSTYHANVFTKCAAGRLFCYSVYDVFGLGPSTGTRLRAIRRWETVSARRWLCQMTKCL